MFVVRAADNFHCMDEDETCTHGEFVTWAEAVAAARMIVDRCLAEHHRPGIAAEALFLQYTLFDDDPFIVPTPSGENFSAWDYAKARCAVLCA